VVVVVVVLVVVVVVVPIEWQGDGRVLAFTANPRGFPF
jgi:hypothetical protein